MDCDDFEDQTTDDNATQDERDERMSTSSKSTHCHDTVHSEEYDSDVEDTRLFIEWLNRLTVDPVIRDMTTMLEGGLSLLRSAILGNGTTSMKAALLNDDQLIFATSLQDKYTNVRSKPKPDTRGIPPQISNLDYSTLKGIRDFSSQVELLMAFTDVVSAQRNLFRHGILHKDISVNNIVIVGGRGALVDFDTILE